MNLTDLVDDAIEISVVGSFSRIGYAVRRRLFGWAPADPDSLSGRTVLVTGPTSGLGRAATEALAALGARVILVGRRPDRLADVRDALVRTHGEDRFPIVVADMASLDSVRAAAERILESEPRLDVLVDNAGAIFPERTESPDGIEATLATMVVGPFALIAGLLPLLRRTGRARVIAVTSGGMYAQRLDLDDLEWTTRAYDGTRAYARAKRAQVALIREWARRIPASERDVHRDASGLGGHTRAVRLATGLPPPDDPHPANARRRRRHDRLACRGRVASGRLRSPLSRSPSATIRPRSEHSPERRRAATALG